MNIKMNIKPVQVISNLIKTFSYQLKNKIIINKIILKIKKFKVKNKNSLIN